MGYIAYCIADSWHIANGQHFGDLIWTKSTNKAFDTKAEAIQTCYDEVKAIYHWLKPESTKGLKLNAFQQTLLDGGREFIIYCYELK